ncbi:MAG: SH3 domain-containing protein [Treponema sp.]|nr:SH3 domain-containing protein [Treponema sp.]
MRYMLVFLTLLLFSFSPAFSQARNTMFVAVETTELRSSTGFFAQDVGTLSLGDEVMVIRDSGRWSEVRAGSLVGWVASASLSPRRTVRAGSAVTPGEVALAGKGFGREIESEYRLTGPDFSLVDEMEALVIPMSELRQFIIEGRLAGGE